MGGEEHYSLREELWRHRWRFLVAFLLIFFLTLSTLVSLGLVPETIIEPARGAAAQEAIPRERAQSVVAFPERVVIKRVGIDVRIVHPQSRDVAVLDAALKEGAVHFPNSGKLGEAANMFLFGHSSYLPIVHNSNYRAFNGLGDLKPGDDVEVYGGGNIHTYRVRSVRLADAAAIDVSLARGERTLTLSTCDSFGSLDERFVVEADFVGSRADRS